MLNRFSRVHAYVIAALVVGLVLGFLIGIALVRINVMPPVSVIVVP